MLNKDHKCSICNDRGWTAVFTENGTEHTPCVCTRGIGVKLRMDKAKQQEEYYRKVTEQRWNQG